MSEARARRAQAQQAIIQALQHVSGGTSVDAIKHSKHTNQQVFRQKIVLLGHQEVGKTSLRKCFESDPLFFKKLPDVRATTGIETDVKTVPVQEEPVELHISDFAGQESYHSHPLFLTGRSVFVLVWKMSALEQDVTSAGISSHEEQRLFQWIDEVYAKFPRSALAMVATHLDEVRDKSQKSVEFVLRRVQKVVAQYIQRIAKVENGEKVLLPIVANFAVSCKLRIVAAVEPHAHHYGGKVSALVGVLADVAKRNCLEDERYRMAGIPGRHLRLIRAIEEFKKSFPLSPLLTIEQYAAMAASCGFDTSSTDELLQVSQLMHTWNIIYLFNQQDLSGNLFIFLYPVWLCKMAGNLFSFAHVIKTPLHLRSSIGGLDYTVSSAEAADRGLAAKGFLRLPLARVLFRAPLVNFLKKPVPDDADYEMCLQLLEGLELLYRVPVWCDVDDVLAEEGSTARRDVPAGHVERFFVPSLSPYTVPPALRAAAPTLFHKGMHYRFDFNMLPNEFWWKLQYRMHDHLRVIAVPDERAQAAAAAEEPDEPPLAEALQLHNRWRDGMWLGNKDARLLVVREAAAQALYLYTAENEASAVEALMEALNLEIEALLVDYPGLQRSIKIACPVPTCAAWIAMEALDQGGPVTCAACRSVLEPSSIVQSGISELGPKAAASDVAATACFAACLDRKSADKLCEFLGVAQELQLRESPDGSPKRATADSSLDLLDTVVGYLLTKEHEPVDVAVE